MTLWPLLLPPPAVWISPSGSRRSFSSSHHRAVSRAVPRRRVAVAPSIAVAQRHLSTSIRHRTVHCRSIAAALASSLAVEELLRRPLKSRSRRAVNCRRGAVAPYLAIKKPLAMSNDDSGHSSRPTQASCPAGCHIASPHAAASHLPAPLIAAIAFRASRLSGWLSSLLASHAATSHLPAPPPLTLIAPSPPLVTPLLGLSSGWLRHHLSSRRRHLSAG
jgi:hypothetical protein